MQNKSLIFVEFKVIASAPPLMEEQGLGGVGGEHKPKPFEVPQSLKFADELEDCNSIAQQQSSMGQSSHSLTTL
ncbi:MAG TPA: hypothetical protein VMZ69_06945 [Saprospiraceae bacterium]|nr:hypothetical protein [Saprospiraceae bacterium]